MEQPDRGLTIRVPLFSILATLLIFFLGFQVFGPIIGAFVAYPFFPGGPEEFVQAVQNPIEHPEFKIPLMIIQGMGALIGMVIIPYYFLRAQKRKLTDYFATPYSQPILIIIVLVVVFMGFNSFFIKWNQDLYLPFGIEEWARPLEEKLAEATQYLTQFDNTAQLVIAFIVIAIIPAFGEEIIFRGMIQNDFYRATKNIHVAIWVSAFLFSAIHFQFYGFVPRMLLGALFGYLYVWSGNLFMPVLAHFINNGFTLVSLLLYQRKAISIDLEKVEPTISQVLISAVLSAFLLYAYKNFFNKLPKSDIPD